MSIARHQLGQIASVKNIGHTFSLVDSDEVILTKPPNRKLALVQIIINGENGAAGGVTIKDGSTVIGVFDVPANTSESIIQATHGLEIEGNLVAQVSDTGITLSAWAI